MGYNLKELPRAKTIYKRGFYISNSPSLTKKDKEFIVDNFKRALS